MNREIIEFLKQIDLFSGLDDTELARLAGIAKELSFQTGAFIFIEGDEPDFLYIVSEGRVKIIKHSSSGKELIVAFFLDGEVFGEVAVFEDKPYPASAQAAKGTKVLAIRKSDFLDFLAGNPQVALTIIGVLSGRLRDSQGRLRDLAVERVEQRLARILLMLSLKLGDTLAFTREEIADMAGTTTETAIRIISRLKEGGIVRSERGRIIITDKKRLTLLSEGPPRV